MRHELFRVREKNRVFLYVLVSVALAVACSAGESNHQTPTARAGSATGGASSKPEDTSSGQPPLGTAGAASAGRGSGGSSEPGGTSGAMPNGGTGEVGTAKGGDSAAGGAHAAGGGVSSGGSGGLWQYTNPVIKGDWSDPAVVRVGEDYYSLRSTFGWQPGLAIMHSKDLVHWEYIGNGFTSLPIATGEASNGIWGSELTYNPNTKLFMIYATYSGLSIFESAQAGGPYTRVSGGLSLSGYDPGAFTDDDGRVYLVTSSGKISELSKDGTSVVNATVSSFTGACEGPELFRNGSYYYVTWSSGGTQRGGNGVINSARSKSLSGPWTPDPTNPILQNLNNGTDPAHPFEGPQHSEVIETQNGEWFVTFHTWENNYGTLARNMCLEPVVWTNDGWWRPKNGKKPSLMNDGPHLPLTPVEPRRSDDFASTTLGQQWFFHTSPDFSGASWSLSEKPGFLRIKTQTGDVNGAPAYKGVVLERIDLKQFDAETVVSFTPANGAEAAGLILHSTLAFNVTLALTHASSGTVVELASFTNSSSRIEGASATRKTLATAPFVGTSAHLHVSFDGKENASFSYSADGATWQMIGTPISVGLDGQVDLSWHRTYWEGPAMGVFAVKKGATADNAADFDSFTVTSHD